MWADWPDQGQRLDDHRVDLPRIGLPGHRTALGKTEGPGHQLVELADLGILAVEQGQKRRLRAGGALDAAHRKLRNPPLDFAQVLHKVIAPQRRPLADGGQLGRLIVRKSQRRQAAILFGEFAEPVDQAGELAGDDPQAVAHQDQVGVVADIATGRAEVNDRRRLGRRIAEGMDMGHHIVAELRLVLAGLVVIDVVEVLGHLVDLRLRDRKPQLLFRLGQFQPDPPPGPEFPRRPKQLGHFPRRVPLDQRTCINAIVCHNYPEIKVSGKLCRKAC